ncbi:MAG TPA: NUDIX hydrolase [Chloroflexota bacterium]|nr:NUDIX hydrolase [Chloroflexota bacterium]
MPRRRASAVLLQGDRILMVRISYRGRTWWCLPGGTIERDETPEETIVRELREELNLRVVCRERLYEAPMPHEDGTDVGILVDALTNPLLPGVDPSVTVWAWHPFDDIEDSWQVAEVQKALGRRKVRHTRDNV